MQKRQFLIAAGGASALALTGCGFQLRGSQSYAFNSIAIPSNGRVLSLMVTELQRNLLDIQGMRVITDPTKTSTAQVVLEIVQDQREKTAVGLSIAGQVREFQLRLRVKFRLRTPAGKDLIEETELTQTRQFSYNESVALAKEVEESQLYRDMQSDLIAQMLRRLANVKSL
jgi:LPS-assembly lipoprotein